MTKKAETLTLALCIALLPPIWAVAGAVALICAGLCAANGDKTADAVKISIGFLLGDFWAWLAVWVMDIMPWNPDAELFGTLFVMGGLAVIFSSLAPKWIFCPAWLCGWAIGLTIMAPGGFSAVETLPLQIAAAMLVGVWYVGVFLNIVRNRMLAFLAKRQKP